MPYYGAKDSDDFIVKVTICLPLKMRKAAREKGVSISRICRDALGRVLDEEDAKDPGSVIS